MQLLASRSYPALDCETLAHLQSKECLFRLGDRFVLYMTSSGGRELEEQMRILDSRSALQWLNAPPDQYGEHWHTPSAELNG